MSVSSVAGEVLSKPSSSAPTTASSSVTTASPGAAKGITKESPKETFMKLLVAQLEHQNPLSPMDNNQFTQQLAQFTSLEQLQSMNANLSALMQAQTTTNGLQAATLIGKQVQAQANTTHVPKQGEATPFQYTLAAASAKVQIDVLDQAGNTTRTINARDQKAGPQTLTWDGKDAVGKPLPAGNYHFQVTATDKAGKPVAVEQSLQGIVEGVTYDGNHPYLIVGGNRVELSALTNIKQTK
jgi:flagellar basal-body rod modification protein FlgD